MIDNKLTQFEKTRYINKLLSVMTQVRHTLESVKTDDASHTYRIIDSLKHLYEYFVIKIDSGKVNVANVDLFIPDKLNLTSADKWDTYSELSDYFHHVLNMRTKLSNL